MALVLLPGEKIYKIMTSSPNISDYQFSKEEDDLPSYRGIFILCRDGNVRIVAQFKAGSTEGYQERLMTLDEADQIISEMGEMLDQIHCSADVYDLSDIDTPAEQLASLKKFDQFEDLAKSLESKARWIRI